ncbi:hypothetical protein QA646_25010 (plasmid) [Rhizobium sp. CB3090]|nr:hypothetical protein [Rhizobium sp. CB3090]WFU11648.1 hypothetical protein QA646_25010 [Rhizobium sp. CB3090]
MAIFDDTETGALIVYILMIVLVGCVLAVGAMTFNDRNSQLEQPQLPAAD